MRTSKLASSRSSDYIISNNCYNLKDGELRRRGEPSQPPIQAGEKAL